MNAFFGLLATNRNYRWTWTGQVVSEIGDHFNNIAVFTLAFAATQSGLAVTGVMLARAVPAVMAAPVAGVLLDRFDRRRIMIASDLIRAIVALLFIFTVDRGHTWLLYVLSGLLMFASPFFTSGRTAILPKIASKEELHTANSLTQTTQWTTTAVGTFLGGMSVSHFGYKLAFVFNAISFLFSAWSIWHLRGEFKAERKLDVGKAVRPWQEYKEGLRYMKSTPLIMGIALISVGWATGGGAAQVLFTIFGEAVFKRGSSGIGMIWGAAGLGLVFGGMIGHYLGKRLDFNGYKKAIIVCYLIHGSTYVVFSQMQTFWLALVFIGISRAAVAVSSVLNYSQLLRHISDSYRGRVFSTIESMTWSTMMISMLGAGVASLTIDPRTIAAVAGVLSSTTAIFWGWAHFTNRLPEPALAGVDPNNVEVHGETNV
jgi:MFS family permease